MPYHTGLKVGPGRDQRAGLQLDRHTGTAQICAAGPRTRTRVDLGDLAEAQVSRRDR